MDTVLCDMCDANYTNSKERGGFLFLRKAVCPSCVDRMMIAINRHGEQRYIRDTCREDETFRDFVQRIRRE